MKTISTFDKMSHNQRYGIDLAEMVQQTLEVLENTGG